MRILAVFAVSLLELILKRPHSRPERAAWLSRFCRRAVAVAHLHVTVEGPPPSHGALISNHLNYTDILVHAAVQPSVFVSKIEVRKIPMIGWISMMAGTLYVERGAGGSSERAAEGMAKGFRDGLPVIFFPEGTTGSGEEKALPFRTGLLAQSILADQPVTAAFLHYDVSEQDKQEGRSAMRDIHWGSNRPLAAHVLQQLAIRETYVRIRFASEPISFSEEARQDRKIAAVEAREAVLALSGE